MKSTDQSKLDRFPVTRWSLVRDAGGEDESKARRALGELCETYWFPIYSFIRNRGHSAHDAEDLTQSFFQAVVHRNSLARTEKSQGKLRSYLLAAVKNFLVDAHRREARQRRGGEVQTIPLDFSSAEVLYAERPRDGHDPTGEDVSYFDREWANIVLSRVVEKMRMELSDPQREALFTALVPYLTCADEKPPYSEFADRFSTSVPVMRVSMSRLRKKFREALVRELTDTVANEEELREEVLYLLRSHSGSPPAGE